MKTRFVNRPVSMIFYQPESLIVVLLWIRRKTAIVFFLLYWLSYLCAYT